MPHAMQKTTRIELPEEIRDAAADCPLEKAINTIGGRWKMLVLRALLLGGEQRFNALLRIIARISAKELTRNLRELESAGLVAKSARSEVAFYALTPLGESLLPAFRELGTFGARLLDDHRQDRADASAGGI
jgi:DNA-binding HxlR family transcriptional regulator